METASYSNGETHQNHRQKKLLKRLTENETAQRSPIRDKSLKNSSVNLVSKIDKSQTRSFCIDDSKLHKQESVSSRNSDDEELKRYVKEFKKKVEKKYTESLVNKDYIFPFISQAIRDDDSESSIQSLLNVSNYNLADQNNNKEKDETEQLVDLLLEVGQLDKLILNNQLRYLFLFKI